MTTAVKWTTNQQDAITRRGGKILVSAAAGSGKTAVLVERILSLLTDKDHPIDASRLLVVTFTNAAAAEMASKIKRALEDKLSQEPENIALRRQLMLLGRAQISTVHSFCISLLRDHFSQLDIPVDFTLADEAVMASLRQHALEQTMESLFDDPNSRITALSDLFGRARSDRDTAHLIEKLYDFESNLAFPERWEEQVLRDAREQKPLSQTMIGEYLFQQSALLLETARGLLTDALELCAEDEVLHAAYSPALTEDFHFLNTLMAAVTSRDWNSCVQRASSYQPFKLKPCRNGDANLKSSVQELRGAVKKIFTEKLAANCFVCDERQYQEDVRRLLVPQQALFDAVRSFKDTLDKLKLERHILDFSDLERYALKLLVTADGKPTETAHAVRTHFDYILVDEYQDTNEIQDAIFSSVSQNGENLFFVGDVKQSIYSFRRADPEIFVSLRDRCYRHDAGLFPVRIPLSHNFRSSSAVVDAVNDIFLPIMRRTLGGVNYSEEGEALSFGGTQPLTDPVGMEVCLISGGSEEEEADYIAQKISSMLREGYPVAEGSQTRPCREKDFCILLRSAKKHQQIYTQALQQAGIRYAGVGGENLFLNSEVAVLLALLHVIDNPHRDVDLTAAMLSPLFNFLPDDLAELRIQDRKAPLYALVAQSTDERISKFTGVLTELRALRHALPVGHFVQHIVDSLRADISLCAGSDFSVRRGNLRLFIDYAENFAKTGGTLSSFLRVCDAAVQGSYSIQKDSSLPSNAVCLTTVHRAKGLEWPIVIVANTDKLFNFSDSHDPTMLFDAALGCGARLRTEISDRSAVYAHRTLPYAALLLLARQKVSSEEMRVLYVALTRARQKLIVTAALTSPQKTLESWRARALRGVERTAQLSSCWIDWIGLACLRRHPGLFDVTAGSSVLCNSIRLSLPSCSAKPVAVPQEDAASLPISRIVESVNHRAAFVYPNLALSSIPNKLSVTELVRQKERRHLYTPDFALDGIPAAERGSAMHLFMQYADYTAAFQDVDTELERLIRHEYLSTKFSAYIDKDKLRTFFDSALGKRAAGKDVLREFAFIDTVPAGSFDASLPPHLANQPVLIQGIADCVILEDDGAILIDYKSDRVDSEQQLLARYRPQLSVYRTALDKCLPVLVKRCVLYSFELGRAIDL